MFDLPDLVSLNTTPGFYPEEAEEQLQMVFNGRTVGSKEEARACMALQYWKVEFYVQYEFNGGRGVRGGQLIDILAKTVPIWSPIYINGSYWHGPTQKYEDTIKMREFQKATRGYFRDPIIIWDYELTTVDQAINTIKERAL